jgi:hypothetical protein
MLAPVSQSVTVRDYVSLQVHQLWNLVGGSSMYWLDSSSHVGGSLNSNSILLVNMQIQHTCDCSSSAAELLEHGLVVGW